MQFRKWFLSCAVVAVAGLLAGPAVMASDLPTSCTTPGPPEVAWTVTLMSGPTVEACSAGSCLTWTYKVKGDLEPDHVAGLMPLALVEVTGPGNQVYDPGEGDKIFELGKNDVSRKAFKVNPNSDVTLYKVRLDGDSFGMGLVPVKIKKGDKGHIIEGACALAGPAVAEAGINLYETLTLSETGSVGPDCIYTVFTTPSGEKDFDVSGSCTVEQIPIEDVKIFVGDDPLQLEGGSLLFSEGFSVVVGNGTCQFRQFYPPSGPVFRFCW